MVWSTGIRTALLESAEHQCPSCETPDQSPDVLIPNKYLRAMVTSFINETSYVSTKKPPPVSSAAASSAGPVAVKTETVTADVGHRTSDMRAHLKGMQLMRAGMHELSAATQIKTEPMRLQLPPAGTQLSVPPSVSARDQFSYRPSASSSVRHATANQTPPGLLESVDVKYSQPLELTESVNSVGQSQSAPSLLLHSHPE